jgi:hypothetical protein
MVRPPVIVIDVGNPDIPERPLIGPVSVGRQLVFVIVELGRKVLFGDILVVQRIPVLVPAVKVIAAVREPSLRPQMPVGSHQAFPAGDELGTGLAGGFNRPFQDHQLGLAVLSDIEPEEAILQNIEGSVGSVNFEGFFLLKEIDPEIDAPGQEMKPRPVIPAAGQVGEFHFAAPVQPEIVFSAETDFRPAVAGGQLVALDQGEVDHAFLRTEVGRTHDHDAALDITQTCVAVPVIFFALGGQHEWPAE